VALDSVRMALAADMLDTERRVIAAQRGAVVDDDMRAFVAHLDTPFEPRQQSVLRRTATHTELAAARTAQLEVARLLAAAARQRATRLGARVHTLHTGYVSVSVRVQRDVVV
jgi:hypothetical protein